MNAPFATAPTSAPGLTGQPATIRKWTLALAAAGLVTVIPVTAAPLVVDEPPLEVVQTAVSGTTISGYIDTSGEWGLSQPPGAGSNDAFPNTIRMPGRLYDVPAKMNGFNFNVVSLTFDKQPGDERWASGFHVQLLAGQDVVLRSLYSLTSGNTSRDLGVNEAYVTIRTPPFNGLEFRLGYFSSPLGYEVYDSYRNPNFSRSYGYYIEPKSHTGLMVKYDFTDWFSVLGGVANNYSPFVDARAPNENRLTYIGLAKLNAGAFWRPDATFTFGYTSGHTATSAPTDAGPRIHNFYAGANIPLVLEGLNFGLAYDYQMNYSAGWPAMFFLPKGPTATYANSVAAYLTYRVSKWQFATRAEYASATQGNTIFAARGAFGSDKPMFGPNNEEFIGVTATVGYQIWANLLTRVECRWDHDASGGVPVFGSAAHPRKNSLTLGFNVVYTF